MIVLGDFNARLGKVDAKFPFHDITNRNGGFLADLVVEENLIVAKTYFHKRVGKHWTYIDPCGAK